MPLHSSSTDITYRDPLDSFTDREAILNLFEQSLRSIQPGQIRLLAVKGNSGTGKTFLVSYLTQRILPALNWQSGQLSFAQSTPDFRTILAGLEGALKGCVPRESLKQYRDRCDEYNRRFDEYRAAITISLSVEASEQSSISNVSQSVQVNAQLRERELQLRSELTRALVELAEESAHGLCLFIDGYERLLEGDPELDGWLWEKVLLDLAKASPPPLLVVTCGWERPNNAAIKPFSHPTDLNDFNLAQVRSYLEKQEVIASTGEPTLQGQEELVKAFYELTKGHPLVLGLAVTYFMQLASHERTAQSLRANRPLVDEQARVQFLEDRLLNRLPEPHRTLLERGPILRHFDQAALQALLSAESGNGAATEGGKLDDRTYDHFLRYPFINQGSAPGSAPALAQPTFHDLVRRVRLEALRHHHPETKEQLHRTMADYYWEVVEAEQKRGEGHVGDGSEDAGVRSLSRSDYAEWLAEIPVHEFRALLEYLYHALQMEEWQEDAFEEWLELTGRAVNRWRRRQAGPLLELVQQLAEEGEPFLSKTSDSYGQYLAWYSRFLEQEARWEEARDKLQEAADVFEQVGNPADIAASLNNIGFIYRRQGKLEEALSYVKRALAYDEQVGNPASIASSLNNIGNIYYYQGKLEEALSYHKRALAQFEQVGNPARIALSLNNIGGIYDSQGRLEEALVYHERALALVEQVGNPADIATSLNNIGNIYHSQGKLEEALVYHERALARREQVGNLADIAASLNNIGNICQDQGNLEEALNYHERALALREQVGNPARIALSLNNIGGIYRRQGKLEEALSYYERALALKEQVGNLADIAASLNNIGNICQDQGNLEEALSYYERALALVEQVGNPADIATLLNNIGELYRQQGKLEEALSYHKRALAQFEQVGNPARIALSLNNIGGIYDSQGRLEEALSYYERALALKEQVGNPAEIAQSLNNIGNICQDQGNLEEALSYFERALAYDEQVGNPADIAASLNNIGGIYQDQGNLEEALSYFERALALVEQVGNPAEIATLLNNIGGIYQDQGNLEEALSYFERALAYDEQVGNPADIAASLNNIGGIYQDQGNLEEALSYFERALALVEQVGNPADIALSHHNIGFIYEEQEKWEQAIEPYEKALSLYERSGEGFESYMADELEALATCYAELGETEKALPYYERAQQMRRLTDEG